MGAYFGPEGSSIGFAPNNPKGYWERRDVLTYNDELLALNGCAWDKLAAWPLEKRAKPETCKQHALQRLVLDLDAHRPWVLKDPRFGLTFEYWRPLLEMPVCVIVHREPMEAARSLEQRNLIPVDYGIAMWEYHAVHILNFTYDLPCVYVSHSEVIRDPLNFTYQLKIALEKHNVRGLRTPSEREILTFVDPNLYRSKLSSVVKSSAHSPHQEMLISLIKGEKVRHTAVTVSEASIIRMRLGY